MSLLSLDTWVSLMVLIGSLSGLYLALRHEFRSDINDLRTGLKGDLERMQGDIGRLDNGIERLDDRVYALATGLRPHLEEPPRVSGSGG